MENALASYEAQRKEFESLTGEPLARTVDSGEAKKARWRTFGNVQSPRQRAELLRRVVKPLEDRTVERHSDLMRLAGMRPGDRDEVLDHAKRTLQLGRLAPAPELLKAAATGGGRR